MKVLEHGERILTRNPWDVGAQMDMAEAAEVLGLLDLAIWNLEQARQKQAFDVHLNRALAHLYEKRGNFTQAIALWELIRKVKPGDIEAQHKIKDLAADDTIARGQYHATLNSGEETSRGAAGADRRDGAEEGQHGRNAGGVVVARAGVRRRRRPRALAQPEQRSAEVPVVKDRLEREAAPLRGRLKDDPTSPYLYLQLAAVYRRGDESRQGAHGPQEGLGPTGNAFELSLELADLDIEPFRRNLAITEEKLKAEPDNAELRRLRTRLRKEINTRELDLHRQKADRYPTEMGHRYEVGVRLLRGRPDRRGHPRIAGGRRRSAASLAIAAVPRPLLQGAQQLAAGGAQFRGGLKSLPAGEMNNRKEILYELADRLRRGQRSLQGHRHGHRVGQHRLFLPRHRPAARRMAHAHAAGQRLQLSGTARLSEPPLNGTHRGDGQLSEAEAAIVWAVPSGGGTRGNPCR